MLFLIISKYNIFFCGGQAPCGGGGSPFAPLVYIFSIKSLALCGGGGTYPHPFILPVTSTFVTYPIYIYLYLDMFVTLVLPTCHTWLVFPTRSLYPIHLLPFLPYPIRLPVSPTLSPYFYFISSTDNFILPSTI